MKVLKMKKVRNLVNTDTKKRALNKQPIVEFYNNVCGGNQAEHGNTISKKGSEQEGGFR